MKPAQLSTRTAALLLLVVVVAASWAPAAESVTCNPYELLPCAGAISGGSPSRDCCARLRAQQPCLCGYARNPNLVRLVNIPRALRVASACKVPVPRC